MLLSLPLGTARHWLAHKKVRNTFATLSLMGGLGGCSLPQLPISEPELALEPTAAHATRLGQSIMPWTHAHPGLSGIYPLADAADAFAVRFNLMAQAQCSLDVQYYIWRADSSGLLLLQALYEAANRGVKVRLLLDDNGTRNLDHLLYGLSLHPNIEVRLFNPFVIRRPKSIGFLFDFKRLNRRMHNKSFTVDNTVTIIGGRNIGDEYFGGTETVSFADLDVMAIGAVVPQVSADFDRYWNHQSAYPIEILLNARNLIADNEVQRRSYALDFEYLLNKNPQQTKNFLHTIQESAIVDELLTGYLDLHWVKTEMVSDDPDKILGLAPQEELLPYQLQRAIGTPQHSVDLISPYFVPTQTGVEAFSALIKQNGVRVRVLTNSYDATDVAVVHAGYIKHRKQLLQAGVELFELRKIHAEKRSLPERVKRRLRQPIGFSGSSLHAKTFAVDGKRLFVGSFNFDPRSALLNTELGFVIHSPELAQQVSALFDHDIPVLSYQVILSTDHRLRWIERYPVEHTPFALHEVEPNTTLFDRFWLGFLSRLPIEWML